MSSKYLYRIWAVPFITVVMLSCSPALPKDYTELNKAVTISPDYRDLVIPCNIAPLNFNVDVPAEKIVVRIQGGDDKTILLKGPKVQIPIKKWQALLEANKSGKYTVEVFARDEGKWSRYKTFTNTIAADSIDEYLSYRLIEPSYVLYENLSIRQRHLGSFWEKDIYNNNLVSEKEDFQCINCHSYQNYQTDNMQFHARAHHAGTMIVSDGVPQKVNLKTEQLISGGVYPAWHPFEKLIAYSVNNTNQLFHSKDIQKVEVLDRNSDLILYDIEKNQVSIIQNDSIALETFPSWSPDGKTLYYSSARFESRTGDRESDLATYYQEVKYNIFSLPFDIEKRSFGKARLLVDAESIGMSALLPRISPDGKYLLFSMAEYGTFHIWHKNSDLYLVDLQANTIRSMEELNSKDTESYHSWSSNGRWIVFSSRRDDGSYTRPYIAYFDKQGQAGKPFILPQKDPDFHQGFMKSYNIPEFMKEPVSISPRKFARSLKGDAIQAEMR
ncbi:MAG: hypothetical protein M0P23_01840 [Bacteroidales bacterium]|nr:hypothetical protein [Bacteroidales bacterium]